MKIRLSQKLRTDASTLLVALVIGGILCLFVIYYLSLVEQQSRLSTRSQSWNIAIAVSEAGVEDALQQLNANPTNLTVDGWVYTGTNYLRNQSLPDGNRYTVTIDVRDSGSPEIVSRAYVDLAPLAQNAPPVYFAAVAVVSDPALLTRAVRVRCARGALFMKAMVAKHTIDLNGNNISTDSFDSGDPAHSTIYGKYDRGTAKDNGDVASNDTIIDAVMTGNANIHGHVATGPGGTVGYGTQGAIGPYSWQDAGGRGVYVDPVTGVPWVSDNMNFTFPNNDLPYTTGPAPGGPGDIVIPSYTITSNSTTTGTAPNYNPYGGVQTNVTYQTVNGLPNPIPPLTVTNTIWHTNYSLPVPGGATPITTVDRSTMPPIPGTYVPPYWKHDTWYYFNRIIGYYYVTYTYTYPQFSYTYNLYSTNVTYTTNHFDHILYSGDYYVDSLSGSTYVGGQARLVIAGGLNMSGTDSFTIAPTGAKLEVYCGGTSCAVSGNGVINDSGQAQNFILYGTSSVTSLALNGNGAFVGVLSAPNADIAMNGAGKSSTVDFTGALVVNSVKMNGHFNFHYDEALGRMPANGRVLITSWDEIP